MHVANEPYAGLRQNAEHAAQCSKTFGRACEETTW